MFHRHGSCTMTWTSILQWISTRLVSRSQLPGPDSLRCDACIRTCLLSWLRTNKCDWSVTSGWRFHSSVWLRSSLSAHEPASLPLCYLAILFQCYLNFKARDPASTVIKSTVAIQKKKERKTAPKENLWNDGHFNLITHVELFNLKGRIKFRLPNGWNSFGWSKTHHPLRR